MSNGQTDKQKIQNQTARLHKKEQSLFPQVTLAAKILPLYRRASCCWRDEHIFKEMFTAPEEDRRVINLKMKFHMNISWSYRLPAEKMLQLWKQLRKKLQEALRKKSRQVPQLQLDWFRSNVPFKISLRSCVPEKGSNRNVKGGRFWWIAGEENILVLSRQTPSISQQRSQMHSTSFQIVH